MISATEALQRLQQGNRRFVSGEARQGATISAADTPHPEEGQAPFAAILGCSDSRVPTEIVFDQAFGDLFVIRVAGNIVAPSQIGSIEFTAAKFGTPLVVVMGHSNCGAIKATLDHMRGLSEDLSRNLMSIIDRVRPSLDSILELDIQDDDALLDVAARANVSASVRALGKGSDMLRQLTEDRALTIVGAEYSLETGEVDFFDVD
jgi:carbonic anhydrase